MLRFERDGESLYPVLDEAIERDPELRRRVRVDMYRRSATTRPRRASTPPSTCPGSCATTTRSSGCGSRRRVRATSSEENLAEYERNASASRRGEPLRDRARDRVRAAGHPLHRDRRPPRVVYGNVAQHRPDHQPARRRLRRGARARWTRSACSPLQVGELPPQCAALNRTFLNVVELTVRAALEGRATTCCRPRMLDPNTAATLTVDRSGAVRRPDRGARRRAPRGDRRGRRDRSTLVSTEAAGTAAAPSADDGDQSPAGTTVVVGAAQGIGAGIRGGWRRDLDHAAGARRHQARWRP